MIKVKDYILKMPTYAPPWTNIDRQAYIRMDLNENTQGLPEHVKLALQELLNSGRVSMYPDYGGFMEKLADYSGQKPENLMVTNGSDQAIEIILRTFLGSGDTIVMAVPGFPMFAQIAGVIGAYIHGVPYKFTPELHFPYDDFIKAVNSKTSLIALINPDNPVGASISLGQIKKILDRFPDISVIVDEAYFEFTGISALHYLADYSNLIITRTFSKAYAMAGLRFGYIIAHPQLIAQFHKIRGPFDVNTCALTAAQAQISQPQEWQNFVHQTMKVSKPLILNFFNQNKIDYINGPAHFMLVRPPDRDQAVAFLKHKGILVRPMVATRIKDTFRMNVGTFEETKKFMKVYQDYLKGS